MLVESMGPAKVLMNSDDVNKVTMDTGDDGDNDDDEDDDDDEEMDEEESDEEEQSGEEMEDDDDGDDDGEVRVIVQRLNFNISETLYIAVKLI